MAKDIRVLLVDDHEVMRLGLRGVLEQRPRLQVVGEAGTVAEAVAAALEHRPDVVVMDIRLPDGSGVEACREIRAELPRTRVIMLTSFTNDEAVFSSIMAGAAGYLLKQTRGHALAEAIEAVADGVSLLDPLVTQKVLERMRRLSEPESESQKKIDLLTAQEQRILALIAEGKTNREIGAALAVSDKTVKNYVASILAKLQAKRRAEAAAYYAELRRKRQRK